MFSISNASGGYGGTPILHRVSLEVRNGEMVGLLGRNGVGKTTLMQYAMGLLAGKQSGEVSLRGERLGSSPELRARKGLGYVPQGRRVFARLSVAENVAVAAYACGYPRAAAVAAFFETFPMLREHAQVLAGKLSGGQQQILAIGRALATRPAVLLLDEPTEGVQPSIVDDIAGILARLNRETGLAMLIAEQDLDFCLSIASRAYVMDHGTVARECTRDDLLGDKALLHELLAV
ncbi:ABC transporter ATP-binding protein [Trinickia acidisoli]|uniref:ABC transporter ATP-binding protein n=1 Tax=Trinickia acidisoli TaxID=2767482 RepID=UPI001A8FBF02|nr:ABC transporter ATP-binding protein [Trinickia acidisoli]